MTEQDRQVAAQQASKLLPALNRQNDVPMWHNLSWQTFGLYEYEYTSAGNYTGWYRYVGGRLTDGRWPEWNNRTGQER
jgi:hypothetical protein